MHKMIKVPDGTLRILVQGLARIRLVRGVDESPYLLGEVEVVPDQLVESREVEALTRNVQSLFARTIGLLPYLPEELQLAAASVDEPSQLCNLIASTMRLTAEEKQVLLELADVEATPAGDLARPQPRARGARARDEDPVAGPVRAREGAARVLPPPAAEGDPRGARRGGSRAGGAERAADPARGDRADRRKRAAPSTGSSAGSSGCRRPRPSTASSAPTSTGSPRCPGTRRRTTTSTCAARGRSSTRTTSTSRR